MRPSEVIVLRARSFNTLVFAYVVAMLALLLGCSSEDRSRDPAFLDSKPVVDSDAEAERLRLLQMVKVTVTEGEAEPVDMEFTADDLGKTIQSFCRSRFQGPDGICTAVGCTGQAQCQCHVHACEGLYQVCTSNAFLDLAAPRTGPYRFDWTAPFVINLESGEVLSGDLTIEVAPQSIAGNAAMLKQASVKAINAAYWAASALGSSLGNLSTCTNADLAMSRKIEVGDDPEDARVVGAVLADVLAEAYRVYGEANAKAVDGIVSVADWQRSHPSLEVQVNRAILGDELSRAEAAHLLVGGQPGLQESSDRAGASMGLCKNDELSGPAQRAVQAIRDAAIDPNLLIDLENTTIEELLGPGTGTIVNQHRSLGTIGPTDGLTELLDELDIRKQDFVEARAQLIDEFVVYSRSKDPNILITSGKPPGTWYAATGSPPPAREAAYYGALARVPEAPLAFDDAYDWEFGRTVDDYLDISTSQQDPGHLAGFADVTISLANQALNYDYGSTELNALIKPTLSDLVAQGRERVGARWISCVQPVTPAWWYTDIYGYGPNDGLIVVIGEEGLECGVQGSIEGAPCNLAYWLGATLETQYFPPDPNFPRGWQLDGFPDSASSPYIYPYDWLAPNNRVYLLKPRTPDGPRLKAGGYVALAGVQLPAVPDTEDACVTVPILPDAEERVGELLKPSRKWCTQSLVSCADESFDARLPLENELSDDQSGVENSWRRYLDLAKQAAAEADLLGQQFVDFGIQLDQREEEIELREHAQEIAVLQELENLQSLCGTNVDLEKLTQLFNASPEEKGTSCSDNNPCDSENHFCLSGRCVPDLAGQIERLAVDDPKYRRLAECIGESQEIDYVTLGDKTLYGWWLEDADGNPDPNSLCLDPDLSGPETPCPVTDPTQLKPPTGTQTVIVAPKAVEQTLDYFSTDAASRPSVARDTCAMLREVRVAPNKARRVELLQKIKATNFFHPAHLARIAANLGWEARVGGFGAVTFNRTPVFETGDLGVHSTVTANCSNLTPGSACTGSGRCTTAGVDVPRCSCVANQVVCANFGQDGWPCDADRDLQDGQFSDRPADCNNRVLSFHSNEPAKPADDKSLFCRPLSCAQTAQGIADVNLQLRNAVIALRLSLGMNLEGISFPFFMKPDYHRNVYIDAPATVSKTGPGGINIEEHTYSDFESNAPFIAAAFFPDLPFPPIVRYVVDSSIKTGWCSGSDLCPASGWWNHLEDPDYDFAVGELGDFLLDSYLEQRAAPHMFGSVFGDGPLINIPDACGPGGCFKDPLDLFIGDWRIVHRVFDGNFWMWAGMTRDSVFMQVDRADEWFASAAHPRIAGRSNDWYRSLRGQESELLTGIIEKYLTDPSSQPLRVLEDLQVDDSTHPHAVLVGMAGGLELAEPGLYIDMERFIDGMELVCEVFTQATSEPLCTASSVPRVKSAADLVNASSHIKCMGNEIESRLGHFVFAHFPADAMDALRRESATGSFPQVGGEIGEAISLLRGALVDLADTAPQIQGHIDQMANDIDAVRVAIERHEIAKDMAAVEFESMMWDRITQCSVAYLTAQGADFISAAGKAAGAAATCLNTFFQLELGRKLERLKQEDADLASESSIIEFRSIFSERAQALERLSAAAREAIEQIDAQLAAIENIRLKARRSLDRAIQLNSFQTSQQMRINSAMRRRFNTSALRYEKAFKNAQRLAFIAKRAVEQRLGVHLSSMTEKLPLVEAPSSWESSVCSMMGIDWSKSKGPVDPVDVGKSAKTANYADAFIGDYVRNLENVVESYRMVHNFHEGLDTAVISLKDDVYRSRSACEVPSRNLLYFAGELDQWKLGPNSPLGWRIEDCETQMVDIDEDGIPETAERLPNCVDVRPVDSVPSSTVGFGSSPLRGFRFTFGPPPENGQQGTCNGCGLKPSTRIVQNVDVTAGDYLLSWYHERVEDEIGASLPQDPHGGSSVVVFLQDGSPATVLTGTITEQSDEWKRSAVTFSVPSDQTITVAIIPSAQSAVPYDPHEVELAGMMLEPAQPTPSAFEGTDAERTRQERDCHDADGVVFRTRFAPGCRRLCANGFDGECAGEDVEEHCYREVQFNLNQRDIESGRLLPNTGFALGNFNYRIESVAVNFVGTGLRDCTGADSPTSCNAQGYIPYTLSHGGPYFVRNHMGADFKAELFTGHIEHARGLGSERYITNPIGSADQSLLEPYTRHEFQGRPLDGNFTLRVWDDPTIDFSKIEDIQVVLHYRYWTRFD